MKTPLITVDGHPGTIFEGELPATYCFVPQECISHEVGGIHVDEIKYVCSGWDVRNMRLSDTTDGQHLFPKPLCPVVNLDAGPVRQFLGRMQHVHCA